MRWILAGMILFGASAAEAQCIGGRCFLRSRVRMMVARPPVQSVVASAAPVVQSAAPVAVMSASPMVMSAAPVAVASAGPMMAPVQTYRRGLLGRLRPIVSYAPVAPVATYSSSITVTPKQSAGAGTTGGGQALTPPPAPVPSFTSEPAISEVARKEPRPDFRML